MIKVVCGFIIHNNEILVAQNPLTHIYSHLWEFPGGKIEEKETNFEAIIREIKEELSLEVSPLFAFEPLEFYEKQVSLQLIICRCSSNSFTLHHHDDASWVSMNQFANIDLAPTDKVLFAKYRVAIEKYMNKT